jgi:hypothetical protein
LKEEQRKFAVIQDRITFRIKLIPLVGAERGNPIGILLVKPVGQVDEIRQILPGLNGPDLHFTSARKKETDLPEPDIRSGEYEGTEGCDNQIAF